MTQPLVSVVIPVFNGADFVGQAIESALAQSWPATEVIVVDDGSNDGGATQRVVSRFGDAVRLITKRNGGVATALNAGIAAMRSDWFTWLSHDDLYHPERIARHMAVLREHPAGTIAFGDVDEVAMDGSLIARLRYTDGFPEVAAVGEAIWAVLEIRLNGCAMTIPRDCILAAGGFDPGLPTTQDYALWFRLAQRHPFVGVPGALVRQRTHPDQGSRAAGHLDEASLLWAGFVEAFDAQGGSPEQALSRLLRAQRKIDRTVFNGARLVLDERLRRATRAFAVDVVLRGVRSAPDAARCLALVSQAGGRLGRISIIDEGRPEEPALAQALDNALPFENVSFVRSLGAATPDQMIRTMLGCGSGDLVALIDGDRTPEPYEFRDGLRAVAAGACALWAPPSTAPGAAAVVSRRALETVAASASADGADLRSAFSRLDGNWTVKPRQPALPLPPLRTPPRDDPAPQRMPAGGRWTPERVPDADLPTVLLMTHDWGGGTERYAQLLGRYLAGRANVLYAIARKEELLRLSSIGPERPEVEWSLAERGLDGPVATLRALGVDQVDVLHTIGFETWIEDFLDALAVPFDVTLLDYHLVANRTHLNDETGRFIGDAAVDDPSHPARRPGPPSALLNGARRIIACSRDLAWRASRLSGLDIVPVRIPEPALVPGFPIQASPPAPGEPLRVVCLGRIVDHKGRREIVSLARLARARGFPIEIHCVGQEMQPFPAELEQSGTIRSVGAYDEAMLQPFLCALRPHLAWLPFLAPETHSFALSDCMVAGLPILATGVGAIPERVAGRAATWLVPLEEATPEVMLSWMERLRAAGMNLPPQWLPTGHLPPLRERFYQTEYLRNGRP